MKKTILNTFFIVGLVFYIIFILWNILFKYVSPLELFSNNRYFSRTLNLIPFNDILNGYYNKMDIIGNIILFIPFGIYIKMISKNLSLYKNICIIFLTSLIFEVTQYIFGIGASDITDIITNATGGVIGVTIYEVITKVFKEDYKVKKFITICSTIIMIPVATLLLLIFINN